MPYGRRSRQRDQRLTFFVDRSLGKHLVAEVFRDAGHDVVLMSELYPDGSDQAIPDDRWIADVSDLGWVALTKDAAIIRDHEEVLGGSTLRVFTLSSASLTGVEMADRFRGHVNRIAHRARRTGPFVDIVYPDRVERRWPAKKP